MSLAFLQTLKTWFCRDEAQLSSCCLLAVGVLLLFFVVVFFAVPSVGLHCVIVAFSGHTHLLFVEAISPIVHTKTQGNWPISFAEGF